MTRKQKRMQRAIRYLADYVRTYEDDCICLDYPDRMFIEDVLYGLGVALDPKAHTTADGYDKWKAKLRKLLNESAS